MKNTSEMKNTLDGIKSMVDIAKEKMNKLGNTGREITQNRHKKDVGSEHQ